MLLREKIERSWRISSVSLYDVKSRKEKQVEFKSVMDDLKDSVDFGHKRVDTLE